MDTTTINFAITKVNEIITQLTPQAQELAQYLVTKNIVGFIIASVFLVFLLIPTIYGN